MGLLGAAGGLLLQEERGGEVLGEGGEREKKHARQKISSESHAPVIPKPPKGRAQSTTHHQQAQSSQQHPLISKP